METIAAALSRAGLAPTRLVVEITEGIRLNSSSTVRRALHGLRALGVALWLDDFGTGYANVASLRTVPFDAIKIDQSFLAEGNPHDIDLLRSMLAIGRAFDLTVIAEGVETPSQLALLRRLGCDQMQGYLLGRPAPPRDLRVRRRDSADAGAVYEPDAAGS